MVGGTMMRPVVVTGTVILAAIVAALVHPPAFIVDPLGGAVGWARCVVAAIIASVVLMFFHVAGFLDGELKLPFGVGYKNADENKGLKEIAEASTDLAGHVQNLTDTLTTALGRIDLLEHKLETIDIREPSSEREREDNS